jgi:branched-chain amino acid transport system substrate-binding protein
MIRKRFKLFGITALLALAAAGPAVGQAPPIRIGEINSYTGPVAVFTHPYRNGLQMAVDEINAKGGVLGRKLELIHRDDNFSPADAVRLANELVLNQKVDLLAGTFLSPIALAVSNYALEKKVVFVAAEALTNQLTWEKGNRYTFRVRNPMYMLTSMLVGKASTFKCTRWAGIGPINEAISDLMKDFQTQMKAKNPDFVWAGELFFPNQKLNPGSAIDSLARMKPDCLLNGTFGPDLIGFAREGNTRGFFKTVQVASVLSGEPEYYEPLNDDTPVGWWVTGYAWEDDNRPEHKKFRDDYTKRFGTYPRFGSLIGYVTIQAIAAGIQRAGSTDAEKLIQGLRGAQWQSPVGQMTMRAADHQSTLGSWVGQLGLKNGKATMVNWTWVDGATALPPEAEARSRRPAGAND